MLVPESVDETLVSDLIETQKLSYRQARNVLKERFPSVQGLSSRSVWRFCSKRSLSSRVSTDEVTEMSMEASTKVISAFWFWQIFFTIVLRFCYPFSTATQGVLSTTPWALEHFQTRIITFLFTFFQMLPTTVISFSFLFIITI